VKNKKLKFMEIKTVDFNNKIFKLASNPFNDSPQRPYKHQKKYKFQVITRTQTEYEKLKYCVYKGRA
jgi:hypothetical protein